MGMRRTRTRARRFGRSASYAVVGVFLAGLIGLVASPAAEATPLPVGSFK